MTEKWSADMVDSYLCTKSALIRLMGSDKTRFYARTDDLSYWTFFSKCDSTSYILDFALI